MVAATSKLLVCIFTLCSIVYGQNISTFKVGLVRDNYLLYASYDTIVWQAVQFWADFVNARGGIIFGGVGHEVEVITRDASSLNTAQQTTNIKNAYTDMINIDGIQLAVCPYTAARTLPAIRATDPLGVLNFATNSPVTISAVPHNYTFTSGMTVNAGGIASVQLIAKLAKTYVMLVSTAAASVQFAQAAKEVLDANGVTMLRLIYVNTSSVDSSDLPTQMTSNFATLYEGIDAPDLTVVAFTADVFPIVVSSFEVIRPKTKAAVYISNMWTDVQTTYSMGSIGDYWMSICMFDTEKKSGVSGQFGGTTTELVADYIKKYDSPPKPFAALTIAHLMAYWNINQQIKTINATAMRDGLVNMTAINTFLGTIVYDVNHTNPFFKFFPIQFVGKQTAKFLSSTTDILYPAPFHWLEKPKANTTVIVAIIVPVGVVLMVALLIGALFIRRQRQMAVHALAKTEEGERRAYKIDFSAVEISDLIGSGSFGHVYKGTYRGADVAIKKLKHQNMDKKQLLEFTSEASTMVGLRHPNILLFMGVCLEPSKLCIITELMARGSLYDILKEQQMVPFPLVVRMAIDCLKGLQFIHSAGFIHRDLKSPNLLVDKSWNIKIADFGLSCGKLHSDQEVQVSLLWTAPEILRLDKNCYSEKSDMYSFAVILWEMMSQKVPFEGINAAAIHGAVVGGSRPQIGQWDPVVQKTIQNGWAQNPFDRLSVKEARAALETITLEDVNFSYTADGSNSINKFVGAPNPPCYFVFTEVESFSLMWEKDPQSMMRVMKAYHEIVHTQIQRCAGYKAVSEDDGFLIVFKDGISAANFCLRVQLDLLRNEWPDITKLTSYLEERDEDGLVYKGPRVKMGVHYGSPVLQNDETTGKPTYNGSVLNEGRRVTNSATGGQVFLTTPVYSAIMNDPSKVDAFLLENVGSYKFKGSKEAISIYEIVPKTLKARLGSISDLLLSVKQGEEIPDLEVTKGSQRWIIDYNEVTRGDLIGIGASGDVHSGTYMRQPVAIKMFLNQKFTNDAIFEMRAESATLCSLDHPNIIDFKGMCIKPPHICLVTELMSKGSLSNLLGQAATGAIQIPWNRKLAIARDIANGLHYLHSNNIIHRDIKSGNVFVNENWKAKIGDFGFSRVKAENQTMTQLGTVGWTSPEIFNGSHYTEKADMFGFAVLLWELIFQQKPWKGVHTMKVIQLVIAGSRLSLSNPPAGTPPVLLELIEKCWRHEAAERPSSQDIVRSLQQMGDN